MTVGALVFSELLGGVAHVIIVVLLMSAQVQQWRWCNFLAVFIAGSISSLEVPSGPAALSGLLSGRSPDSSHITLLQP